MAGRVYSLTRSRIAVLLVCWGAVGLGHAVEPPFAAGYEVRPWSGAAPVPVLAATDLSGKAWRLSELRGKVVLINFWASWCEPCRAEMPSLQQLADQEPQRLVVLAVNFKENESKVRQFVQRTDLRLPVLQDAQGSTAKAWGVSLFPSTVLIDATGRVQGVLRGELDWTAADAQRLLQPLFKTVVLRP